MASAVRRDACWPLAGIGRRRGVVMAVAAALCALLAPALLDPSPRLVWNVSDSAPRGLYWIGPPRPMPGDYAAARLPPRVGRLAAERHYLPFGVPLIKQVGAVPGDEVCASKEKVTLFGKPIARRRAMDPARRPMPWWSGCRRLGAGEYLLINPASPWSFDGRYFGPTASADMLGRARLIWAP